MIGVVLKRHGWRAKPNPIPKAAAVFRGPAGRDGHYLEVVASIHGLMVVRSMGLEAASLLLQDEGQLHAWLGSPSLDTGLAEVMLEAWDIVVDIRARTSPNPNPIVMPWDSSGGDGSSRDVPAVGSRGVAAGRSGDDSSAASLRGLA